MSSWRIIRSFKTSRFSVILDCEEEQQPDTSWMDAAELHKLESGEWVNVVFRVRVLCDGREIGSDYLGNNVYADVREFAREHLGIRPKARTDGANYGCYFSDMTASAIAEARTTLRNAPRVRS